MKTWDIEQEAMDTEEVMVEAMDLDTEWASGEAMGIGQDTLIQATQPDAQDFLGYSDGGGITPTTTQPYRWCHRFPLLTRRNST